MLPVARARSQQRLEHGTRRLGGDFGRHGMCQRDALRIVDGLVLRLGQLAQQVITRLVELCGGQFEVAVHAELAVQPRPCLAKALNLRFCDGVHQLLEVLGLGGADAVVVEGGIVRAGVTRQQLLFHLVEGREVGHLPLHGLFAGEAHGQEGEAVAGDAVGGRLLGAAFAVGELNHYRRKIALVKISVNLAGQIADRAQYIRMALVEMRCDLRAGGGDLALDDFEVRGSDGNGCADGGVSHDGSYQQV